MLTSLKIKKYLRSANKTIRSVNDGILHDDLWRGRFYARQKKYWKKEYEDKSGLQVIFLYEFVDLKTGYTKEYWIDGLELEYNSPFTFHVWQKMNDFIVKECDVWRKEGRDALYADKTVYRTR